MVAKTDEVIHFAALKSVGSADRSRKVVNRSSEFGGLQTTFRLPVVPEVFRLGEGDGVCQCQQYLA